MKRVMILNGPNLNLLGVREPHIYGTTTLAQIKENCEAHAAKLELKIAFHQSNHEGVIIDLIQSAREDADAIIINPAGFSFTSVGIMDAIKALRRPRARSAHLQHPRPRRISPSLEDFVRGDRRDLRTGTVRLHRRDADHRPDRSERLAIDSRSDCPWRAASHWPIRRAVMSMPPPAAKPATIRVGRVG